MVGLLLLKQIENLSDERVVEAWTRNPYDGDTLKDVLKQVKDIWGIASKIAYGDRGFRGLKRVGDTSVSIPGMPAQFMAMALQAASTAFVFPALFTFFARSLPHNHQPILLSLALPGASYNSHRAFPVLPRRVRRIPDIFFRVCRVRGYQPCFHTSSGLRSAPRRPPPAASGPPHYLRGDFKKDDFVFIK
jgi:hypothetical protein